MRISDRIRIEQHQDLIDIQAAHIHNASTTVNWIDMSLYDQICFYVWVGPIWDGTDQLDTLHIEQADSATGGNNKALVPAVDLDQTAVNTAGDSFALECTAAHCDTEGGFHWVRLECVEDTGSGVDQVCVIAVMYGARYQHGDMAATTGEA